MTYVNINKKGNYRGFNIISSLIKKLFPKINNAKCTFKIWLVRNQTNKKKEKFNHTKIDFKESHLGNSKLSSTVNHV